MRLSDPIYGSHVVTSPLIIQLIQSGSIQRLKHIAQLGVPDEFFHNKGFSRYDHSIGVYLLLRSLGASEEEQIAGLLHDINHTAFSHVIDWVITKNSPNIQENYQDRTFKDYLCACDAALILKKCRMNFEKFSDHKQFLLLEREIPEVCADRIDYTLRQLSIYTARYIFENCVVKNNTILFKNKKAASIFAMGFLDLQKNNWGAYEGISRYKLFAECLRIALKNNIISKKDFWKHDDYILSKIKLSHNKKIRTLLKTLESASLFSLPRDQKVTYKKFRHVDPKFIKHNTIYTLSHVDATFNSLLKQEQRQNNKGIHSCINPFK